MTQPNTLWQPANTNTASIDGGPAMRGAYSRLHALRNSR